MMKKNNKNILFWLGLILAIWFGITGGLWTYNLCLFIAYPFGLLSFCIWLKLNKNQNENHKYIGFTLLLGFLLSMLVLAYFLIFD